MKTKIAIRSLLFAASVILMTQAFGQGIPFKAASKTSGNTFRPPATFYAPDANRDGCLYLLDDGTLEDGIGLIGNGDIFWMNYFVASPGCQYIHTIWVAWGYLPAGTPARVILYEDPTDDGDPIDAEFLTDQEVLVEDPATNIFHPYGIIPTYVTGGFFVAVLNPYSFDGEYPASIDETVTQGQSWVAAHWVQGGFDFVDLQNNELPPVPIDDYFPGNWLLRAEGSATPIPLANWALFIGVGLIVGFTIIRLRRL
jgi:hypothetical protein